MQILQERQRHTNTQRQHCYEWTDCPGAGFSFDVDDNGSPTSDNPASRENWDGCQPGGKYTGQIVDMGIQSHTHEWVEPAVGRCDCGAEVVLDGFTCPCECGRDYNSSGQLLAHRSQWGEETGEELADILRIA
jgi:hypothetical protein